MKNKILSMIIATIILVSISGCAKSTSANSQSTSYESSISSTQETESSDTGNPIVSEETTSLLSDATTTQETDIGNTITFSGSDATITGTGATLTDSTVTITQGGIYTLVGDFTGSVVISTPATDKVQLILDGVNIKADRNAAIYCIQADLLSITLAEGSVNTLADAENFSYSDTTAEEPSATLFSKTDLAMDGTGSLNIMAKHNNGIGTKDDLVISSGVYEVTAANHGIRGRDSITVLDGDFTITSVADGIQSNNDEDASKGWILLEGGVYNITAENDAIQAETTLTILAGDFTLKTGGGNTVTSLDTDSSYKGLKATTDMLVSGGNFSVDSADDTVHANGNIEITGGVFSLSTGDDGVHADGNLSISGTDTKVEIITAYEGLEAKTMTISDGIININTSDDGINVAGGNDTAVDRGFGNDQFRSSNGEQWLLISGGNITVLAGSDAIDINGNGSMTGGTVSLTAALLGEGQTIDVDGTWEQTGGELTETGGSGFGGPGGGAPGDGGPGGR